MTVLRPEYPRPQFVRKDWLNLNTPVFFTGGDNKTLQVSDTIWQFEIDPGDSGLERGLLERPLRGSIRVPFCPESQLSGVEHTDFMKAVWYRRSVEIPAAWQGRHVLLHFQAVDYDATIWVNGVEVGRHRGGYTPFTCDLSAVAQPGAPATIVIRARDYNADLHWPMPSGKQSRDYHNSGCMYTRTTGIWQTVWMEPVAEVHFLRPRITPDVGAGSPRPYACFRLELPISRNKPGYSVRATLSDQDDLISKAEITADGNLVPQMDLIIPADRVHLWEPDRPYLYDLILELVDESDVVVDRLTCYAGLRSVTLDGNRVLINGKPVFQRLVLDQGFYPDGIYTAPSDEALQADIQLSMAAGFNGARLHQKVFEERFLYHADRLGYLVWGEFPDWGCGGIGASPEHQQPTATYITQWLEAIQRDYSHPAIIGWCPLNETWQALTDRITTLDDITRGMFLATKALDPTRPVLDSSGYSHRVPEADIYDSHDYEQDPVKFKATHDGSAQGQPFENLLGSGRPGAQRMSLPYHGQPYFVSEFGGIWWNPDAKPGDVLNTDDSWGYGNRPRNLEEFYTRFEGLCNALLDNPGMFGYCYTQLTDVFQEQNGIYCFDRRSKFDIARIRQIQSRPAVYENRLENAPLIAR
jgi:beta-galactosidase/beta-glucuronidase